MHTTFRFSGLRFVVGALIAVGALLMGHSPLAAQSVSSLGVVSVNIRADVWWQTWTCDSSLTLDIESVNGARSAGAYVCDPVDGSLVFNSETNQILARLVPGRVYYLNAHAYGTQGFAVHAIPEAGYTLEIENVPAQTVNVAWDGWYNLRLRIRPPDESGTGLRAGMATPLGNDRLLWQLSLGSLANGDSAGSITFIDLPYLPVSSVFKAANITYDPPSPEVWVRKNPSGVTAPNVANALRQVIAPQVCVDIVQTSDTTMEMKVYHRSQLSSESGGFFNFTGDPIAWYLFSRDGTDINAERVECHLRDLPTSTSSGLPVVRNNVTRLARTGSSPNYTWTATDWHQNGQSAASERVRVRTGGNTDTFTVAAPGQSANPAAYATRTLTNKSWGEEVATETLGNSNAVTTTFTYWEDVGEESAAFARVRSRLGTGGGWEAYEYYDYADGDALAGQIRRRHEPFKNSDTSVPVNLASHAGEVTEYQYTNDPFGRASWPTLVETKINGTTVAKSEIAYVSTAFNSAWSTQLQIVTATRKDYSASGSFLTTVTKYFREDAGTQAGRERDDFFRRRLHSITKPDGTKQSFAYQRGTWNGSSFTLSSNSGLDAPFSGFASRTAVITGSATTGNSYTSYDGYPIDEIKLVPAKSTLEVTLHDAFARVVRTETYLYTGSGWQFVAAVNNQWNLANQLVKRVTNESPSYDVTNGSIYDATYSGDFLLGETDESGIALTYTYDAAGRVDTSTKAAGGAIPAITTKFFYDAAGRTTETHNGWGLAEKLIASRAYDAAGRVTSESAPGPNGTPIVTSYAHNPASRQVTVTLPNGGTRIETQFADGSVKELTGTAVIAQYHTYEVQTGGLRYARVNIGGASSVRLGETWLDWLGRTTKTSRPGFTGQPAFVEESFYDPTTGQLRKATRSGFGATLYQYDAFATPWRSGLDLNANDTLDLASLDRITDGEQFFENTAGAWWLTRVQKVYPNPNSATALTLSTTRQRLTGFTGNLRAEVVTTDVDGNSSTKTVSVDRATKTSTVVTTGSGLTNSQTETYVNGLPTSVTRFDGLTYSTGYDALHRRSTTTDPRTGTTTMHYRSGSTFVDGIWGRVDAAGNFNYVSRYYYDNAGRVIATADAAGKITRTEYDVRDQPIRQWGQGTQPVEFGFNSYGERETMRTYRGGNGWSGVSGPNFLDWPGTGNNGGATPGAADWTRWVYDEPSGLLRYKYDAANLNASGVISGTKKVSYEYNARGQIAKRTWARGAFADYGYYNLTGELHTVTYSDSTPDITYGYTRTGQIDNVTDDTGLRTFVYNPTNALQLDAIGLSSFYANRILTRHYDGLKRPAGVLVGTTGNLSGDLSHTHAYNALGRFETITSAANGQASRTFSYGYNGGGLVSNLGVVSSSFAVSRVYEPYRDLLTTIESNWGGAPRTRYDYTYNALGQRATAKQSGSAFADLGGGTYYRYAYNDRGELTEAVDYLGEDAALTSSPQLAGRRFGYTYDNLGNRSSATRALGTSVADTYWPNSLNQYTQRENDVAYTAGTAETASSLAVTGGTAAASIGRAGRYWGAELTLNNTGGPAKADLTITATLAGSPTLERTEQRTAYLAQALQVFGYDDDGNLTGDGVWNYVYDAENRLVQMTTTSVAVAAGFPNRTLEFRYDYLGRRVQKRSLNSTTATDVYRRYLYDGSDLVAEYDATSTTCGTLRRSYTWGLDLAGSLSATGGVGALVQLNDHSTNTSYFPTYDGNGNIASLLRASDGAVMARYEYSPFGELLRCEGTYAKDNPFRFSTKFTDEETGLVYYGARYYSPSLGRFINRDPIEEKGGLNLYGFAGNDGVNGFDVHGLFLKKLWNGLKKLWNKFRHTIISAVLYAIPVVGPALSLMYNTAVGARYGGIKGMITALASGGALGGYMQTAAHYYGLYKQFGKGKFLNNVGNFLANRVVWNTAYHAANEMFSVGAQPIQQKQADPEEPVDTTGLEKIDPAAEGNGTTGFVLAKFNQSIREWEYFKTDKILTRHVFVNGILGSLGRHIELMGKHLSGQFSGLKQYTLMNNKTHGGFSDILEAGLDVLGISSHPARVLARGLKDALARGLKPTVVGHSQGGAILTQSLRILQRSGTKADGMSVIYHAAASNSIHATSVARSIGVAFGGHAYSSSDMVAALVGMNANVFQVIPALLGTRALFGDETKSPHTAPNSAADYPWNVWYPATP